MLKIKDYNLFYDKKSILKDINLEFFENEIVLLVGKCASGKTSLLYSIQKLIPEYIEGEFTGEIEYSGKCSMVFQNPETQIYLSTVEEELAFGLENYCIEAETIFNRVEHYLDFFHFQKIRYKNPIYLSGGEKQRLIIASASAIEPNLLLFDEPISQLDKTSQNKFIDILKKLKVQSNNLIFIAEHNIHDLYKIADRMVLIDKGKIQFNKKIDELCENDFKILENNGVEFVEPNYEVKCKNNICNDEKPIILKIDELKYFFDSKNCILDIKNFVLLRGNIIGISGNNGSGKTTFFKLIAGFYKSKYKIDFSGNISYIPQNPDLLLFSDSVINELFFNNENVSNGYIEEILNLFELTELKNENPLKLSWGNKHKLAVAIGLSNKPELLLLDEPFTSMDKLNLRTISKKLFNFFKKYEITVLINSHSPEILSMFCDKIINFKDVNSCYDKI